MISRCTNSNNARFNNYGGANPPILVCERWRDSFVNFFADLGERPSAKHSLSRFLDTGNYEPGNVEWALDAEQRAQAAGKRRLLAYRQAKAEGKVVWRDTAAIAA